MMDKSTRFGVISIITISCLNSVFAVSSVLYEIGDEKGNVHGRDITLSNVVKRILKREAIKHNHYRCLRNGHIGLIHLRQKRGWINEDFANRATDTPAPTTSTTLPPPIFGGFTDATTQVVTATSGSTTLGLTSSSPTSNMTESTLPTAISTTESSTAPALPVMCLSCFIGTLLVLCANIDSMF